MTYPLLYSFRRCPYAMRARLALVSSGMVCEIREIRLSDKPAEMLAVSPAGTVPVLVLPDGTVCSESLDIMHLALTRHDPQGWLKGERAEVIARNDGPFKHHLDRFKYATRYQSDPDRHYAAAVEILSALEQEFGAERWLHGAEPGITDMATAPFVRQFAAADRERFEALPLPRVRAWLAAFLVLPLFSRIMERLEPWVPGDAPVLLTRD